MKKAKGQSSLEALLISLLVFVLMKGVFVVFWVFIQFLWIDHNLYQGLVCRATKQKKAYCHKEVLEKIATFNVIGQIKNLELKQFNKVWKGSAHWDFYKWNFKIKNQLDLSFL